MGAGEGATITGRRITVSGDAVAVAVMVMVMVTVVAVGEAAVPRADKQGNHIGQGNMVDTDPDRYHLPRRSSPRQLQPNPSILAPAVRRTLRRTPHNCNNNNNNLALHNRIRLCRSRTCRRKCNHTSILGSRNSLV